MTKDQRTPSTEIMPFTLHLSAATIDDLHERLRRTRLAENETVTRDGEEWEQGIPLNYVRQLSHSWLCDHDWRRLEGELNAYGQWHTELDGLDIHFLHIRSSRTDARPLLITHGWPGSVVEALDVIDGLVNPPDDEPAFHVVLPSLPGFGFSEKPSNTGWGLRRIADAWAELMDRLGYERFLAQGGDWGAMVTITLAIRHPEKVAMMHTTVPHASRPGGFDDDQLTNTERAWLDHEEQFRRSGMGYAAIQSTRPQTVGYGLVDSPVALLSWIIEKFHDAADCDGHPENAVSRQRLLDNVALYWFSASGASSARLYWENINGDAEFSPGLDMTTSIDIPSAVSVFPKELRKLPRSWVERRFTDLRHWNVLDRGGHFPMLEVPDTFVTELRTAFFAAPL
ncbi:epoxide hydrolase family protein [Brevibacterium oceani]|uniref:epoxide hydrolase family protein n=1 Tax=Brevibacterium oceani TaxID=358099 RepID=UPI001FE62408|nr:epoxide hydrolase family protein [Brevibacterium oceani]